MVAVSIENAALTVAYTQPTLFDGTFYLPEVASSLNGSWSSANSDVKEILQSNDGQNLSRIAFDLAPPQTSPSRFLRIRSVAATTTAPDYTSIINATSAWLTTSSSLADGAIFYTSSEISPYYGNLAALGLLKSPANYAAVQKWMRWYVAHLNTSDRWGLGGTIYDYNLCGNVETSTGNADSTDSYAATFLTLAWAYWQTGDPGAQAYIQSIGVQLNTVGHALTGTQQADGLSWAKPDYQIKYLMDNCEGYQGLQSAASLFQTAFGDSATANYYATAAANMLQGIETDLWSSSNNSYFVYAGASSAPDWTNWYPDATAQLFPILTGVITPTSTRANALYAQFNANFPSWPLLHKAETFPWALMGYVAAQMGDSVRARTYVATCNSQFVANQFPWPWYDAEAGWFIRQCALHP